MKLGSLALLAVVVAAGSVSAQSTRRLTDPQVYPESFGMISGLRELADGRVLIADPLGQALTVVNMSAGTADTVGGVGGGPKEYRQPDRLFALPGDSTLLVDLGNGRLTILDAELNFVETIPIMRPGSDGGGTMSRGQGDSPRMRRRGPGGPPGGGAMFVLPNAVDAQGRIYFRLMSMGGGFGQDSGRVGRWDRSTSRIDTVASFKPREVKRETSGGPNNQNVSIRPVPLSLEDDWAIGPDGRVFVVRSTDYHVDWVDGHQSASGPSVQYRPVRVGRAEKERYLDDQGNGIQIGITMNNGQMQTSFGRGGSGRRSRSELNQYEWPDVLPPFRSGRAQVAPDGVVWVERYSAAGESMQFDLFDETGRLTGSLEVGAGRRLVGFGENVVYLAAKDEFDLEYLERYAIPGS